MTTSWSSMGFGAVVAGEGEVTILPKYPTPTGTSMGVLYCHGAGGPARQALEPAFAPVLNALASAGHPVLSCDLGGLATWGNDVVLARMGTAKAYLHATLGARPGKILLVGASMGGLSALVWAKNNPTLTAGVIGIVPVSDVTDMHTNNRQGLRASIDSAYPGGWSEAAHGATRNPVTVAAAGAYADVPMLLISAQSDTTVLPSTVALLTSRVPRATHISIPGTHDMFTVPIDAVTTFMDSVS